MSESKIELTERLRREGRWAEASKFKDETVKKLREGGMKRSEANEQAWEEMAQAFPPLPPSADPPAGEQVSEPSDGTAGPTFLAAPLEDIDVDALLERAGNNEPDLIRDPGYPLDSTDHYQLWLALPPTMVL